jgi:hypothetical protein
MKNELRARISKMVWYGSDCDNDMMRMLVDDADDADAG